MGVVSLTHQLSAIQQILVCWTSYHDNCPPSDTKIGNSKGEPVANVIATRCG
jgi:hypothetical protein